ncbi:MAG: phosphonoacetaldehyde hydrolase [Desulfobacterales bacterium]|jgi:phosphonoacetaldehyde hydrolase|nr:phosphonoacetaldehyde hydrolase [Desulfobacterales bacterium]
MTRVSRCRAYAGPVRGVILDWAGTAVDYGCMGPAAVFVDVFQKFGVAVTMEEARQFMGLMKKDHLRGMCALPRVAARWQAVHGGVPGEADIDALYAETEPMMVAAIARHAEPIPGLLAFVDELRRRGIRIGSSTGYTRPMMDVLVPAARAKGYRPDAVVCSSDVPAGRPYPWMCLLNAIQLQVHPMEALVKIGDTPIDIEEGLNAGMWTVGVTRSGNLLGLPAAETDRLEPSERTRRLQAAERALLAAGAHYTVEGIWAALPVIEAIEARLAAGERP